MAKNVAGVANETSSIAESIASLAETSKLIRASTDATLQASSTVCSLSEKLMQLVRKLDNASNNEEQTSYASMRDHSTAAGDQANLNA